MVPKDISLQIVHTVLECNWTSALFGQIWEMSVEASWKS